jgi:hypothetical protein
LENIFVDFINKPTFFKIGDLDITLFVNGVQVVNNKTTFLVGANYQFFVQYANSTETDKNMEVLNHGRFTKKLFFTKFR